MKEAVSGGEKKQLWTDGIGIVTDDREYAKYHNDSGSTCPMFKVIRESEVDELLKKIEDELPLIKKNLEFFSMSSDGVDYITKLIESYRNGG